MATYNTKYEQVINDQLDRFITELRVGKEYIDIWRYAWVLPFAATIHSIAAKCIGEKASIGALLGAAWPLTFKLIWMRTKMTREFRREFQHEFPPSSSSSFINLTDRVADLGSLVMVPFLSAKMVTLLGYPLTTERAYKIGAVAVGVMAGLWVIDVIIKNLFSVTIQAPYQLIMDYFADYQGMYEQL